MAQEISTEITASIEGTGNDRVLVLRVPMNDKPTPSASGKTLVVSSSHGNVQTKCTLEYEGVSYPIIIGVNAYIKAKK